MTSEHPRTTAREQIADGPYARVAGKLRTDRCVILDGANGSELIDAADARPELDEHLWGLRAVLDAPDTVEELHRRYVAVGCDVVTTDSWGLATAIRDDGIRLHDRSGTFHWMDLARNSIRIARAATAAAGRGDEVAVAFSLNGDVDTPDGQETIRLLARVFESDRPDLILLETLSLVRSSTYQTVESLLATGVPVWLSFRRCRHGVCGVYGEHWGGPEGDSFGRAARRFEELGAGALLINCIPPDHATGMLSWLRDFTDLPLGVYPNLGYLSAAGWRHETSVRDAEYAELALGWREEGAQIIGGCCGVGPSHLAAAAAALDGTRPGRLRVPPTTARRSAAGSAQQTRMRWTDSRGRNLFPLEFPDIIVEPGVQTPTQADLLVWSHLYRHGLGAHQRCLDIGGGPGLQAVQLALNGAAHVHAFVGSAAAAKNTLTNAFRTGVASRVSAATGDLYPWLPDERYDLIVATVDQVPLDPFGPLVTHRRLDYWGRNLIDHLITLLPRTLAADGVAYFMQLSIVGELKTLETLAAAGFSSHVVDFALVDLRELAEEASEQIQRVESLSDAYHIRMGDRQMIVAYLIEITRADQEAPADGA